MQLKHFKLFFLSLFLFTTTLLYSGARIVEFRAIKNNNAVVLEWTTDNESNLAKFNIQRSSDNIHWGYIGSKTAQGETTSTQHYTFVDNSIFKSDQSNFYYRLICIDKNGQQTIHDVIVSVTGNSGIRHTWGSIKAMFR